MQAKLKLRGIDAWGNGAFNASRISSSGKVRKHKGIDYACSPGIEIMSPCLGEVTKLGWPYSSSNFRYVEVTDLTGELRHRVFYIEPSVRVGDQVTILTVIGKVQNISNRYSTKNKPKTNHLHYEILTTEGEPLDPGKIGHE